MGKNSRFYTRSCDVLIIGGGSVGLRAAIEAHDAGANVLTISKSRRGDPHTVLARGGINAALGTMDPKDSQLLYRMLQYSKAYGDKLDYTKILRINYMLPKMNWLI